MLQDFKFANIVLRDDERALAYPRMYCVAARPYYFNERLKCWELPHEGTYDFTTYFNACSIGKWRRYTVLDNVHLHLELAGAPFAVKQTHALPLARKPRVKEQLAQGGDANFDEFADELCFESFDVELSFENEDILIGFIIEAEGPVFIRDSYYYTKVDDSLIRPVELALASTTFKKEEYIIPTIHRIREEIIEGDDLIAQHFNLHIVDNGRTLDPEQFEHPRIHIHPNPNYGGSAGFARGMIEAIEQTPPATNVLLMDDDVSVCSESIIRTFNLLALENDEYKDALISGAMLNFDIAEDFWEDLGFMTDIGTFAPVKPGMRITLFHDIVSTEVFEIPEEIRTRVYAAWWYCCIPISTILREGMPLPFFVRCDDAEYGIRCQPHFITMIGICVWHESFHARYNQTVERYQTTRNTLIAQATTGMAPESDFMQRLDDDMVIELRKFCYLGAELLLDGFEDFLRGPDFISQRVAEDCFMRSNRKKEQLLPFDELQVQLDEMGIPVKLDQVTVHDVYNDKGRTRAERLYDHITDNGQRLGRLGQRDNYAIISAAGWEFPSGKMHKRDIFVAIDIYNQKGIIRQRDTKRYQEIMKRYRNDLAYFRKNKKALLSAYANARPRLTSMRFWKEYLGLVDSEG